MSHQVFISYSSKDRDLADATRDALEAAGVKCWAADKDIKPTESYAAAIIRAIETSRLMLLIFTADANASRHVAREVEAADRKEIPVLTFRVEDSAPEDDLKFFLSSRQWFDALPPPPAQHFARLAAEVRRLLGMPDEAPAEKKAEPPPEQKAEAAIEVQKEEDGGNSFADWFANSPLTSPWD